jgi:hypothetical protein
MSKAPTPARPLPLTQFQQFYRAHRAGAETNEEFLWLVEHGMTRQDLQRCIERRPALWERFSGFLRALPSVTLPAQQPLAL